MRGIVGEILQNSLRFDVIITAEMKKKKKENRSQNRIVAVGVSPVVRWCECVRLHHRRRRNRAPCNLYCARWREIKLMWHF